MLYRAANGPSPGAAATPKVTTGTTIKTMLQLLHATQPLYVVEWGISFDGISAATPIQCELIDTGATAATVTAYTGYDVTPYNGYADATVGVGGLTLSTTGSGYTATGEGTVAAPVRSGDAQLVAPSNQYVFQFPLGQEFFVPAAHCLRIRVTAPAAVDCQCYAKFAIGGA